MNLRKFILIAAMFLLSPFQAFADSVRVTMSPCFELLHLGTGDKSRRRRNVGARSFDTRGLLRMTGKESQPGRVLP
jgi:hypothetical protein